MYIWIVYFKAQLKENDIYLVINLFCQSYFVGCFIFFSYQRIPKSFTDINGLSFAN